MPGGAYRGLALLLTMLPQLAFAVNDEIHDLQARFDRESNSVHKAKLLEKLGDAQLSTTRHASGRFSSVAGPAIAKTATG